ncbi:PilW family protein [Clostridium formicaceticum]|uniref:Prepilin-type N-terminal cleavage/methylation domain-containing protein n=1 Tax=Clostridium formicaceticum TaxID=1497 RepID=A0AAC9RL53_9CLOT|nr:type II secretion system protein [Clostridium formicaceticum]AOY77055.1 hypothetical protein BJL90_15065 [Clostridium formicaceticum]ARE87557.1 hypothetical protein CLFO_19570 [Clostridium formicaceticum]
MKIFHSNRGITLVEVLLAMTLFAIILMSLITILTQYISYYRDYHERLAIKQSTRLALNYIEKRIRECNHQQMIYHAESQTIEGQNSMQERVWVDLSGQIRYEENTLLYFNRTTGELRVNKNKEHNVLVRNIKEIIIREIIEGRLIEIEVIAAGLDYSVKTSIRLCYW